MASPLKGRFRANIQGDQIAYVNTDAFEANQFLPLGTQTYQVYGVQELDASQRWPGGPASIQYSFKVAVGTSKADISQYTADTLVEMIADEVTFIYKGSPFQGFGDLYLSR